MENKKNWNLSQEQLDQIASRTSVRGELTATTEEEALSLAEQKSITIVRTFYVFKNEDGTSFMVNAHGVQYKGQTKIATFKKGQRI